MIKRSNFLLSKAETVCVEETARLEQLNSQSNQVHQLEIERKVVLTEIQAHLAQMAASNQEKLKSQALTRAEGNKRQKLSSLENKFRSYERQV